MTIARLEVDLPRSMDLVDQEALTGHGAALEGLEDASTGRGFHLEFGPVHVIERPGLISQSAIAKSDPDQLEPHPGCANVEELFCRANIAGSGQLGVLKDFEKRVLCLDRLNDFELDALVSHGSVLLNSQCHAGRGKVTSQ
ncbi:hypothetical protein ANTHELSMS3_04646 (plasmid) [Antarctobacter heliothermus]|uniref:Uncharacterized protein n=1 Tax=Antarctobacter heliothermus TaxID=74033 RepID=A0A222EC39_9RHOB|nr:hypothetical protein ANTHELSMS3_04646 [Antarctobacter heliothermus]